MAAHLIVSGEDAADFLQSQFSNDLRPFSDGHCTYGLWLDVKGKIAADSWVLCEGEEQFRIFSEHCKGELIREKLEKHIIADDVELGLGGPVSGVALIGDGIESVVAQSNEHLFCFAGRRSSQPSCELVFSDEASRRAWVDGNNLKFVSQKCIDDEQMQAGISVFTREVLPGDLPGEAGLVEDAISFTKGCFLGQEVVARMHNVGRPQRGLFVLSGSGDPPRESSLVTNEAGKLLGDLRTSLSAADGWKGVAMLKSRFVECGMQLFVEERLSEVQNTFTRSKGHGHA